MTGVRAGRRVPLLTLAVTLLMVGFPAPAIADSPPGSESAHVNPKFIDATAAVTPRTGSSLHLVPPFLDAVAAISTSGELPKDSSQWATSTTLAKAGSLGDEARVTLRVEGKGDRLVQSRPEQTMLVYSNSLSMGRNDPKDIRCEGMRHYARKLVSPDELGLVDFESHSRLAVSLTKEVGNVMNWIGCYAVGESDIAAGLREALDELIPKKRAGYSWSVILLSDGCHSGKDPRSEIRRAVEEGVHIFTFGLYSNASSEEKLRCEPDMIAWAKQTGGAYYWLQKASDLVGPADIPGDFMNDVAGKPPKSGAPMVRVRLGSQVEVIPGSFRCLTLLCTSAEPSHPAGLAKGNRGLELEWDSPVKALRIRQILMLEFKVRAHEASAGLVVVDPTWSIVQYDRYDGSPGGSDVFPALTARVDDPGLCAVASSIGGGWIEHEPSENAHAWRRLEISVRIIPEQGGSSRLYCDGRMEVMSWEAPASSGELRFRALGQGWNVVPLRLSEYYAVAAVPADRMVPGFLEYYMEIRSEGPPDHQEWDVLLPSGAPATSFLIEVIDACAGWSEDAGCADLWEMLGASLLSFILVASGCALARSGRRRSEARRRTVQPAARILTPNATESSLKSRPQDLPATRSRSGPNHSAALIAARRVAMSRKGSLRGDPGRP